MRNPIRPKNLRPRFWPAIAAACLALAFAEPTPGSLLAGAPLIALWLFVRGWGAGHLVKNDVLTCSGPYAYVRHPFYLGTLAIGAGFAAMLGGRSALVALLVWVPWFFGFYFPRKERIEGARLSSRYGETYRAYRAAVPALWPLRGAWTEAGSGRWAWSRYDENNELGTLLACALGAAGLVFWTLSRG